MARTKQVVRKGDGKKRTTITPAVSDTPQMPVAQRADSCQKQNKR